MANLSFRALSAALVISVAVSNLHSQPTQHYKQTNLVADTSGTATTDSNLVNAWGISRGSTTPWWVSDNGTGRASLYNGNTGAAISTVVTVPSGDPSANPTGTPTGQIFNGTQSFQIASGKPALFLFATEDGTISGWNPGVNPNAAIVMVNRKSASVFKGLAVATLAEPGGASFDFLYVADFRKGRVAIYDPSFKPVPMLPHAFHDGRIPHGFAPFNIQNIGGNLYVAYAKQDDQKHDDVPGAGRGYVDVFSPAGRLLLRLQHGAWFNAPWAIAQAASDFGEFSHNILVGQFGSGEILAFDPVTGEFRSRLYGADNHPITIDGLWGIGFGNGTNAGPATTLFFAAGPGGEQHGMFGTLTPVENALGGDH